MSISLAKDHSTQRLPHADTTQSLSAYSLSLGLPLSPPERWDRVTVRVGGCPVEQSDRLG